VPEDPISVDFAASEPHFLDHLAPIAREARSQGLQTRFFVSEGVGNAEERHPDLDFTLVAPESTHEGSPITVCSSWADAESAVVRKRRVVLVEHGAGQSYSDRNPSYVGGTGREHLVGVLVPNDAAAARHRKFYRNGPPVEVVGSPRVDDLIARYGPPNDRARSSPPLVAISWHWECRALPETDSAFREVGEGLLVEMLRLERLGWVRIAGHAHPRAELPRPAYERLGIPQIGSFEDVCREADVYMVDNSSTLFEFAALGRPVIVVNSPNYRRRTNHGLRFWEAACVGPNVWNRRDVAWAVAASVEDGPARQADRAKAVRMAFGDVDGGAAKRAVAAIVAFDRRGRR
jgi:CDP-Glycerol:Poly(glycerophosphate) glycerophosphotransferase